MKHPGRSNMRQGRGKRVACWPDAASISRAPDKRPRPHGVCTCARASAGLPGGASPDTELSILPEVPSFHRPIQRGILLFSMKFSGRVPGQSARGPQRSGRRPSPRSSPTNRPLDPRPEARRRRPNADLAPNVGKCFATASPHVTAQSLRTYPVPLDVRQRRRREAPRTAQKETPVRLPFPATDDHRMPPSAFRHEDRHKIERPEYFDVRVFLRSSEGAENQRGREVAILPLPRHRLAKRISRGRGGLDPIGRPAWRAGMARHGAGESSWPAASPQRARLQDSGRSSHNLGGCTGGYSRRRGGRSADSRHA
jgi:hypothetical protein